MKKKIKPFFPHRTDCNTWIYLKIILEGLLNVHYKKATSVTFYLNVSKQGLWHFEILEGHKI